MNIKLASALLFCSVALSCSVSEGQLLDRMLSKVGCSICDSSTASLACDTGCDTGCGGGMLSSGCGAVDSCGCGGGLGILDKIKSRLATVGCGGGCNAVAEPCGCVEPVVESCGCEAAPSCGGGLLDKLKGRLSSFGSGIGCGCLAPADDCGCAPAPIMLDTCGCSTPSFGLLDRIKGRLSSIGSGCGCEAAPADCGCEEPVVETSCGCDATPGCGGLLGKLKGRFSGIGCGCAAPATDCGCEAPVVAEPCGCDAAPVSDCGCNGGRIRGAVSGVFSRVKSVGSNLGSNGCGCETAPACGCESTCGDTARLTLIDRLRGNRIPRDRFGKVFGSGCNDGCNSPCPTENGCGSVMAAPAAGCNSCGSGEMIYTAPGAVMSEGVMDAPAVEAQEAAPVTEGVIEAEPAIETDVPAVDPNAFINRNGNVRG